MVRYLRRYWDEEDIWFFFELDPDGWVTRQIEFQGPGRTPIAAASLDEWTSEHDAGRASDYEAKYGVVAEKPITAAEVQDYLEISPQEFERAWTTARRALTRS